MLAVVPHFPPDPTVPGSSPPAVPGYRALRPLGRGGTGEVWLAAHEPGGELVALKRLVPGHDGPEGRARMRREAAVLAQLRHEHLLRLRALHSLPDGPVLVLDHAGGGSLRDLVAASGPLSPGEVVTLAAPLAQALAHVHAHGIVHGDVSPANVLLTSDGRPLLADLGVARLQGERPGEAHGTDGFTDPAVLAGEQPGFASDVHGLGALCRWALGPGGAEALPPALAAALDAATAHDPAERPDAVAFASMLLAAGTPLPLRLPPAAPATEPGTAVGPQGRAVPVGAMGSPGPEPADVAAMLRARPGRDHDRVASSWALDGTTRRVRPPTPAPLPARAPRVRRIPRRFVLAGVTAVALTGLAGAWVGVRDRSPEPAASSGRTASGVATPRTSASASRTPSPAPSAPSAAAASTAPAARPAAAPSSGLPEPTDWAAVLDGLYARRSSAFATGSTAALADVYAPGSADLRRNETLLRQLRAVGGAVPVLGLTVVSAAPTAAHGGGGRVVLDVVDKLAGWTAMDAGGSPLAQGRARGPQRVRVELVPAGAGWLIASTRQVM